MDNPLKTAEEAVSKAVDFAKVRNIVTSVAIVLVAIFVIWTFWPKDKLEVNESKELPEAKEAIAEPKVQTKIEYIYVHPKEIKPKLHLPEEVQKDDNKQVTATGKLKAEERDYTLSAVTDLKSGQSSVYARPDPLPWIGPGRQSVVGLSYDYKMPDGQWVGSLYGRQDLIQIKKIHGGVRGSIDTDATGEVGVYAEYRF